MGKLSASITPVRFRAILISSMALLLVAGVSGFYAAQKKLNVYADEISTKVAEAEASKNSVQRLQSLESELERLKDIRSRASSIVAESQSYQYQNQIITDLSNYAQQSGITISQYNFQAVDQQAASGTKPEAPATPEAGASPAAAPGAAGPSVASLKSTVVSISLNPPINYTNLLRFMRSVEQNLTKMQISGISLTPGGDKDEVSTGSLNIEVYIK